MLEKITFTLLESALFNNLSIDILLLDSNCSVIDSVSGTGTIIHDFIISGEDIYTIKIRNSTDAQLGQKCWVKITYQAPETPDLTIPKNICTCNTLNTSISDNNSQFNLYPNPVGNYLFITSFDNSLFEKYIIFDIQGKKIKSGIFNAESIYTGDLSQGMYMIKYQQEIKKFLKK